MASVALYLQHGLFGANDLAILFQRIILGVFFILARFRVVYDPSRPAEGWFPKSRVDHLKQKVGGICGYSFLPWWFLAGVELIGGAAVIVGCNTVMAALGLACVTFFGTLCTWRERVCRQQPADKIDRVSCYLWLPEPIYLLLAINLMLTGAGRYSLDALIAGFLR